MLTASSSQQTSAPMAAPVAEPEYQPQQSQAQKAPSAAAKRPGLFDRLAGTVRQQSAPPAVPQQPTLTVDNSDRVAPAAPQGGFDDDLDIPAFLRRQAN